MISVLFLIPTLDRGGAENVLLDLVNHLDQDKFKITVQTLFDQNSQKNLLRDGIEYKSFLYHQFHGNSRLFAWIPARLLYQIIVRKRYDIVVSYLEGPTTHIISGCPFNDSKKAAWIHVEMDKRKQLSVGFRSFKHALKAYKGLDCVNYVARSVQDSFHKIADCVFENEAVLYNTVNTQDIINKSKLNSSDETFSKNEVNIISVGRIINAKGFDRLAHIQKRLHELGYKTHAYILGTGIERDSLEKYVNENAISETFTFLGFQENPYSYIKDADLFVCSSRREGFSTAVTEALVLGVPVVSTKCSGSVELLGEHNEYGIVTENNEHSLFEGIKYILDNPDAFQFYRQQAKIRGQYFNIEKTVHAVEDMLTGLVR